MEITENRKRLIEELQRARGGTIVLTYVTSTRPGWEMQIAMDTIERFYRHLKAIQTPKEKTKIDLFLSSNGGDPVVPWKLVTLIREYCSEFNVLVPYRAFSAATLIALGADHIYMHPSGMLGPTDPKVANEFNPPDPLNPPNKIGINVEDVTSYIALAKKDFGIKKPEEILRLIAGENKIHPLSLGHVKRFQAQARMVAKKLLKLHMGPLETLKIHKIADELNSKFYFHGHPINRVEARELGLPVLDAGSALEKAMWDLYKDYENEMELEKIFNASVALKAANGGALPIIINAALTLAGQAAGPASLNVSQKGIFVESALGGSDLYTVEMRIDGYRSYDQNGLQDHISVAPIKFEWK